MKIRGQVVRLKETGDFVVAQGDMLEFGGSGSGLYPPLVFPADLPVPLDLMYHPLEAPTRRVVAEDVDIIDVEFDVPDGPPLFNGGMKPTWHAADVQPQAEGCRCACVACAKGQCCNRRWCTPA